MGPLLRSRVEAGVDAMAKKWCYTTKQFKVSVSAGKVMAVSWDVEGIPMIDYKKLD